MDDNQPQPRTPAVEFFRNLLPLLAVLIFLFPGYVFFSQRGGLSFLAGLDFKTLNLALFPLLGLYAFTLVWFQLMIGSSRSLLRQFFPGIITFHRRQGVFALLFALLHPLMLLLGIGPTAYFARTFVDPSLMLYVWIGYVQLALLILTAGTAMLMKQPWLQRRWKVIHYFNYIVFVLIWIHSWFLGADVQSTSLKYLWYFFALTAAVGTALRLGQAIQQKRRLAKTLAQHTEPRP